MAREMRAGDLVELRSPAEILATLGDDGTTDGLPFMPEMLEHFGKTFRVENRVERACNTLGWGVRRIPSTVILDDLRCSGKAHAGCQAGCRLYWKEEWLRPASGAGTSTATAEDREALATLAEANTEAAESTPEEPVFRCQGTEW